MTAAKEERRLLGYRVRHAREGNYLGIGGLWQFKRVTPVPLEEARARMFRQLESFKHLDGSLRLVRVYAKPKPAPERKSLGEIAYEALRDSKSGTIDYQWDQCAIAVVEEVRRRLGEKFSLVGSNCIDIAWDQVIAEAKEGK